MKRKINLFLTIALTLSMLTGTSLTLNVNAQRESITIGALGPLAIPTGVDMENGAKLAVSEINAGDGVDVDGTPYDFELLLETTSGSTGLPDADTGAANYNKLVAGGAVAMLGGFRTEVVVTLQFIMNVTGIPFLGVGSTAPIVTEYFYRVGPVNGTTLARNLIALYGTFLAAAPHNVSSVVIVREDAVWTSAIGAATKGALEGLFGMTVDLETVDAIPESASGSDVASAMSAIDAADYDAILPLFSAPVGQRVTEQWAALGLNEDLYMAGINVAAQDSDYLEDTGDAATGEITLLAAPPDQNPTPTSAAFKAAYEAEYGEQPTYTAFAAYDSVMLIKDAIERAKSFTSADIHAALPDADYKGVSATIRFTSESSAAQVASASVPATLKPFNNTVAHDLFTTSTVGVSGFPYNQPYFAQWFSDGTQGAVWGGTSTGFKEAEAPSYVSESEDGFLPGFEALFAVFAIGTFVIIRRRKN
ncbi:MAG: ABC transporter substrate-binding protein [Candidatus Heimdallarchaeota archaeon]|nr:ABC transporter substrate-binding protein [Candidatus Heimdallarchaeota archaeon]